MKKKFLLITLGMLIATTVFASPDGLKLKCSVSNKGTMSISGENVSDGMGVNLQIENPNGSRVFFKQTEGDKNGTFKLEIDMEKAIPKSGSYTLKAMSQKGVNSEEVFSYCKVSELTEIVNLINREKLNPETAKIKIADILKNADNKQTLSYINLVIKQMLDSEFEDESAAFLADEESITLDNIKTIMTKISVVNVLSEITNVTEVKNLFSSYDEDLKTENIKEFSQITETIKERCMDRIAQSTQSYINMSDFYEKMYHTIILSKLDFAYGTGAVLEILKEYDDIFDLTILESSDNDKNAMLLKIAKAFEDGKVNTIEDVTNILDVKILKYTSTSSGGSGSSKRGSSSIGTVVSTPNVDFTQTVETKKIKFEDLNGFEWAQQGIDKLVELGVLKGYSDTEFVPGNNVTRAEFCAMLCRLFGVTEVKGKTNFADVLENDWFAGCVNAMSKEGIVKGRENQLFCPNDFVTRQDAVVMLFRALQKYSNVLVAEQAFEFSDKDNISEYALSAVNSLKENNIVSGKNNNLFAPIDNMIRAEAAQMMYNTYIFVEGEV